VASATLGIPGYDGQPAVYLYIAALEVNVLNCRDDERLLRSRAVALPKDFASVGSVRLLWSAGELGLHV
jgi:hypothetical protein